MRGQRTRCSCGAEIVLVLVIPETPRRGAGRRTRVPLDADFDPAVSALPPSHALSLSGATCRPITRDHPLLDHENPALTHFATCPSRRTPEATP
ncbi:hypothetical protein [Cellulomonas olei]|uniref:hypothetical protein n=1 Tax=Cellulomonas sp. P4 TaxID=3142533 RepID=UPI0031BAF7B4